MIRALDHQSPDAADAIYGIFQRSYVEEAALLGVEEFPPLKRTRAQIQSAATTFLGRWEGSELAAVLEYRHDHGKLCIESLVVEPKYFRRGLASQLLSGVLESLEWHTAEVETGADNDPAIQLYCRFGFEKVRQWRTSDGIEKVALVRKDAL